ncbi:MAG: MerR family transcriptional regulator [Litorimonas sp.]
MTTDSTVQTDTARGAQAGKALSIREFAAMFGVTPRTVRFYEDKGLLSPERSGQARMFHARDVARFERILRGKRLGFSLDDIGAVFDVLEGRVGDRSELQRRRDNFQTVIDGLAERRRDVALLEQDMTEIVSVIDEHLSQNPDAQTADVANLAERYQAALAKHLTAQQGSI